MAFLKSSHIQYIYTMVTSYIKGADRCILIHIHPRVGWYVSYTLRVYYTHLEVFSFQLTTGPLVEIVVKFSAKITFMLFTGVHLSIWTQLTTNPSGSVQKQTFHSIQSLSSFAVKAKIRIHRSCDLTWLPTVSLKCCRITWQRDTVSTCTFLLHNIA